MTTTTRPSPGSMFGGSIPVRAYTRSRIHRVAAFVHHTPNKVDQSYRGIVRIEKLYENFKSGYPPKQAAELPVQGVFSPLLLLNSGWWEKGARARKRNIDWRDPAVQGWLFRGFDEWAPSLDISIGLRSIKDSYLFGQLGFGDEAESILVVIPGEKGDQVRDYVAELGMAFPAIVTGVFTHRNHLPRSAVEKLPKWGDLFDYCLQVHEDNEGHGLQPLAKSRSRTAYFYSGYLWKCVAPQKWIDGKEYPELKDAYFIWEHTEFTDKGAVEFNLDSLKHKMDYLEGKHGKLVVLQNSSPLVSEIGDPPIYTENEFCELILGEAIV